MIRCVQESDYYPIIRVVDSWWGKNVSNQGCNTIRCITSPMNKNSMPFHAKIGFRIEDGDAEIDGIQISSDYGGKGQDRVLFYKELFDPNEGGSMDNKSISLSSTWI